MVAVRMKVKTMKLMMPMMTMMMMKVTLKISITRVTMLMRRKFLTGSRFSLITQIGYNCETFCGTDVVKCWISVAFFLVMLY